MRDESETELSQNDSELDNFETGVELESREELAKRGQLVSKRELREIWGVSPSALDNHVSRASGHRSFDFVIERGKGKKPWKCSTAVYAAFRDHIAVERGVGIGRLEEIGESIDTLKQLHPNDPRWRVANAQANRLEIKIAKESGETVAIPDADEICSTIFAIIRSRLQSIASRITQRIASELKVDASPVERIIKKEVATALSGLSQTDIMADAPKGEESEAAESDDLE